MPMIGAFPKMYHSRIDIMSSILCPWLIKRAEIVGTWDWDDFLGYARKEVTVEAPLTLLGLRLYHSGRVHEKTSCQNR